MNNGQQILDLIQSTREAARSESQRVIVKLESVKVATLVDTVVSALSEKADAKEISLSLDCQTAPQSVLTDSLRLQQILTNLLSNAIRYTDEGSIQVTCSSVDEQSWKLAVRNTGRGIDPELHSKIFEPYFQAGDSAEHPPESSGLGLSIVNQLVQLLQGKLELVSEPGIGSTFAVVFPQQIA